MIGCIAAMLYSACTSIHSDKEDGRRLENISKRSTKEESALIFQPGDSEPTVLSRTELEYTDAERSSEVPVRYMTVIRNRCTQTATFLIGPRGNISTLQVPSYQLSQHNAVSVYLTDDECVYLLASNGLSRSPACVAGGWVIFLGDDECSMSLGIKQ